MIFVGLIEFVLTCNLDEVESLTAARANALSGTEPSDALRVGFSLPSLLPSIRGLTD